MKSNNQTLGAILQGGNQYVVPLFQRHYRWERPQWDKLWQDLISLRQPQKTGNHFMGFLVLVPEAHTPDKVPAYQLIDGQQRLCTLSLILCAIRDVAKAAGCSTLAQEVMETYVVQHFKKDREYFRVYPRQTDRDDYFGLVKGEDAPQGRMGDAYRYFIDRVRSLPDADTEKGLRDFCALVCARLEFVHATLDAENPYNIYKSLNSTGVRLSEGDLIRNFVFMHVPVDGQDQFDDRLWRPLEQQFQDPGGNLDEQGFSDFFRDFLMQDGAYVRPPETFEAFHQRYADTDFNPWDLAGSLNVAARWHCMIAGREEDANLGVGRALADLRQFESSTTYPLLLNLYHRRMRGEIADDELKAGIQLLNGFILRRLVCGESSRGYGRMFAQACLELRDAPVENLRHFLEAKGYPDDSRFVQSFLRLDLYHSRYCRAVLERIERASEHKEPVDLSNAQVEHIMPQALSDHWRNDLGPDADLVHATWLHTVGNLTLSAYNAKVQNKPFAAKREVYDDSHVEITKALARYANWTEGEMMSRGRELASLAAAIWIGPAAPPTRPATSTGAVPIRDLQLAYWTVLRDLLLARRSIVKPHKPLPQAWMAFAIGKSFFNLEAVVDIRRRCMRCGLIIWGPDAKISFRGLQRDQDAIEAEMGTALEWRELPGNKQSQVVLRQQDVDLTDRAQWHQQHAWLAEKLEAFHRTFSARIKTVPAGETR